MRRADSGVLCEGRRRKKFSVAKKRVQIKGEKVEIRSITFRNTEMQETMYGKSMVIKNGLVPFAPRLAKRKIRSHP